MSVDGYDKPFRLLYNYKIVDKNKTTIDFRPHWAQQQVLDSKSRFKIILKARQIGMSTGCLIDMLDDVTNLSNMNECILADEQDSIEKLFRIPRFAYDQLDHVIKPDLERGGGSKYSMFFPGLNSRIYCDLSSHGDTINRLHISEAAYIKDWERARMTMQAVPKDNGQITIESTPNGLGNEFYEIWKSDDRYERFFFPWFMFAEYVLDLPTGAFTSEEKEFIKMVKRLYGMDISEQQIAFRRWKQKENKEKFVQYYPEDDISCFLASGDSPIDLKMIFDMLKSAPEPIYDEDGIQIWEEVNPYFKYALGADTAEGKKQGDYSVAAMFATNPIRLVALVRGHHRPFDFAHKINDLCKQYVSRSGYPLVAVERNNHGHAVLQELYEHISYPNLFIAPDGLPGWVTNSVTRPVMIDTFIDGLESKMVKIPCKITLDECLTLVINNGKIEAADNKHDDCVVACSIGVQMAMDLRPLEMYSIDKRIIV